MRRSRGGDLLEERVRRHDRGERIAQLVGEHGEELVLALVGLGEASAFACASISFFVHAQEPSNHRHELDRLEGLRQILVCARLEPRALPLARDERGRGLDDEDVGGGGVVLELPANVETADVGQLDVEGR